MSTIAASTAAAFFAALLTAHQGDTIALAPGRYNLSNGNPLKMAAMDGVTVTSADPKHPAVITSMFLKGLTGITFTGLELDGSGPQPFGIAFQIMSSDHVTFDRLNVHGVLTGDAAQAVTVESSAPTGFMVRDSTNFTLSNSEIQRLGNGFTHLNINGLTIKGNNIHDIRTDAIDGGGSSNVLIDNNTITNSWPGASADKYHPDGIQFWTTNTTKSAENITIMNNKILRGIGNITQGIFMGNELGLPYKNVRIAGNRVEGMTYHGITVTIASGVVIEQNIVGVGKPLISPTVPFSWIRADRVDSLTLTNNWADTYRITPIGNGPLSGNHTNSPGLIGR